MSSHATPLGLPPWAIFVIIALVLFWPLSFDTIWNRLTTEVDGTIVSSRDIPATWAKRHATEYIVRGIDGEDRAYAAGATDASLERGMPVGTRISKHRWELGYEKNGKWVRFPIGAYVVTFIAAIVCLVVAFFLWVRGRPGDK
jgi:hypothetical protein